MPLTMQDSANAANLTAGYDSYGAYVDGDWPTFAAVVEKFPDKPVLGLTTGLGPAEGIDIEPGNVSWDDDWAAVPGWVAAQTAGGVYRPVCYIGLDAHDEVPPGEPASSNPGLLIVILDAAGIGRGGFRLTVAHWTGTPHICTSARCDPASPFVWWADGTQWAGNVTGPDGYDLNLLADGFFDTAPPPIPTPVPKPPPVPTLAPEDTMFLAKLDQAAAPAQYLCFPNGTKRWVQSAGDARGLTSKFGPFILLSAETLDWWTTVGATPKP